MSVRFLELGQLLELRVNAINTRELIDIDIEPLGSVDLGHQAQISDRDLVAYAELATRLLQRLLERREAFSNEKVQPFSFFGVTELTGDPLSNACVLVRLLKQNEPAVRRQYRLEP